jgi:hypothetical protein
MMTTKLNSLVSKTRPSSFGSFRKRVDLELQHARDGSSTTLVSSRPHAQLEYEDPMYDGAEDEGRSI